MSCQQLKSALPYAELDAEDSLKENSRDRPAYFCDVFDSVVPRHCESVAYANLRTNFDFQQTGFSAPLRSVAAVHMAVYANVTRWICGLVGCRVEIGWDDNLQAYLHILHGEYGDFVIACVEPSWLRDPYEVAKGSARHCRLIVGYMAAHSTAIAFATTNYVNWVFGWLEPGEDDSIVLCDTVLHCSATCPSVREYVLRHLCERQSRKQLWELLEQRRRDARILELNAVTVVFPRLESLPTAPIVSRHVAPDRTNMPREIDLLHDNMRAVTIKHLSGRTRLAKIDSLQVVIKSTTASALEHLLKVYGLLGHLQGTVIPWLYSVYTGDPFREPYVRDIGIVLSSVGTLSLEEWLVAPKVGDVAALQFCSHSAMLEHVRNSALAAVNKIHTFGVVHLGLRNHIIVDPEDLQLAIVGFEHARFSKNEKLIEIDHSTLNAILSVK